MSIRFKLLSILTLTLVTFFVIGFYAVYVYQATIASEQKIRDRTNQAVELARQTESRFNSQLNVWKNVLLRGSDTESYHQYLKDYYQFERDTRKLIEQLHEQTSKIKNTNVLSKQLLSAHLEMGRKFREAIRVFNATDINPGRVTDLYVVGAEDVPSILLNNIIKQLIVNRTEQLSILSAHRQTQETFLLSVTIIVLIISFASFFWLIDASIAKPAVQATYLANIIENAERVAKFGAWDWDSEHDVNYWSDGLYDLLDRDKKQMPSLKLFLDSLTEQDRERVNRTIEDAQKNISTFILEANIQTENAQQRIVLIRGQVTNVSNTNHIRMTSIISDITERKLAQQQITQSEFKFRALFEAANEGILIIKDGHFIDCNPETLSIFGCTRDSFLGKTPADFSVAIQYDGRDTLSAEKERITLALAGQPQSFPWHHCKLDGTPFDADISLIRIELDGQPCLQAIVRDVTERKRTQEAIKNIAVGVSSQTGENFFQQLVIYISKLFDTKYAFIGLIDDKDTSLINTLAVSVDGNIADNFSYSLHDSPCANVVENGNICAYPTSVQAEFPDDILLQQMGVDGYIGSPLFSVDGKPLGLIVLLHDKTLQQTEWVTEILQIFSARASAELERKYAEKIIKKQSDQLRASIDTMFGAFYMLDEDGYVVNYNKGYLEMFNLSDNDMKHYHGLHLVHPDDLEKCQTAMIDVLVKGEIRQIEFRTFTSRKKDTVAHLLATGSRLFLDGKPYLVGAAIDISERLQAEQDLYIKDRAMEAATEGIVLTDANNNNQIVYVNKAMEAMTGYGRNELINRNPRLLQGLNTDRNTIAKLHQAVSQQQACQIEILNYRKNGESFWNKINITPVQDESGNVTHFIGTQLDVTDRRQTEEALRRSQKMEAVGQLAGGIAHDFNNQLGIVIGYLDFLQEHLVDEDKPNQWVNTATQATLRCMDLTRQLLTFSRNKAKETSITDLNNELDKMATLITRSITPAITVHTYLVENLWAVDIDPGEFQDAILNLILNARDAMPKGGQLIIETTNKQLDAQTAELNPGLEPGEYVQVMVSDSGEGMDKATQERVFEPFFTTKPEGKGTGLGLAMVYSFARRYGGEIKIYSELGVGTTFRLYLPHTKESTVASAHKASLITPPKGEETVLIVDDEADLLQLAEQYLHKLGYQIHTANNPQDALKLLEQHSDIDLLFSDVVMPGNINGYALAEQAVITTPGLKVLLTSGFTDNTFAVNGQAKFDANLLHKPYRQDDLAQRIRSTLDRKI